ncbi:MAG TPA: hypothetical protein VF042_13395 [Gemmatimonadaceae bacterium]
MLSPRDLVRRFEEAPSVSAGEGERFNGYGVMGLPFKSQHALALRKFPASSIGPGYTALWHRAPNNDWTFYTDLAPQLGCPRFFGALLADSIQADIHVTWAGPFTLHVSIPGAGLEWEVELGATPATRFMNAVGRMLPEKAWQQPGVLSLMERVAGPLLHVGRVGLQGTTPNGQRFVANPRLMWAVTDSQATRYDDDFGQPGPLSAQAHLGDFWIPQRGIFAMGGVHFEPYDPSRHSIGVRRETPGDVDLRARAGR